MGQACSSVKNEQFIDFTKLITFKNKSGANIMDHVIDIGNDSFAKKICKENGFTDIKLAHTWIDLYKSFMVTLAWHYEEFELNNEHLLPNRVMRLSLPYEVLQVWKLHVLYTENFISFSYKITNNKYILDFIQPYNIWKTQDIEILYRNFLLNKRYIQAISNIEKKTIDSIFIFQAAYQKNILNFNIYEIRNVLDLIVERLKQELTPNPNTNSQGLFQVEIRDLHKLQDFTNKVENVIYECIPCEHTDPPLEWVLTEKYSANEEVRKIADLIQHFELPNNFANLFARHHLINLDIANFFIDEYRKFLFLAAITKKMQTPSEETDQVCHYHMSFTSVYQEFSKKIFGVNYFHHNPSEGKPSDGKKYLNIYEVTRENLKDYFGACNNYAWPCSCVRFSKFYKWKSFYFNLQCLAVFGKKKL